MLSRLTIKVPSGRKLTATCRAVRLLAVALLSMVVLLSLSPVVQAHEAPHSREHGIVNASAGSDHGHRCCHGEGTVAPCSFNALPSHDSGFLPLLYQARLRLSPTQSTSYPRLAYAPPNPPPIPVLS